MNMNVTQEKIDDLNAVIKVKLTPEDYRPKYEATLKDYSRKAQVKGFRPGHVPMAMIKKMSCSYGDDQEDVWEINPCR